MATETREDLNTDRPWLVIVWNDPVNLMSYVTYVFQKLFGYSFAKATRLMLDVHHKGRAVVASGPRERAELDVAAPPQPRVVGDPGAPELNTTRSPARSRHAAAAGSTSRSRRTNGRCSRHSRASSPAALEAVGETDAQLPEGLRRLFPAAYPTDAAAEANYVSLVRGDLVEHHRNALETLAHTALATHLSDDETDAWLAAVERPADRTRYVTRGHRRDGRAGSRRPAVCGMDLLQLPHLPRVVGRRRARRHLAPVERGRSQPRRSVG